MIDFKKLKLVNYCYPDMKPLRNIMRLPKDDAFKYAEQLAKSHPDTTAFGRFADFINYYELRLNQDNYLYNKFIEIGGKPEETHPLSFVIEGSDYLNEWFGFGTIIEIPLKLIKPEHISFTLGDSGAEYQRNGEVGLLSLDEFRKLLESQTGDYNDFLKSIGKFYVEVQVWSDEYFMDYLN